MLEVEQQAHNPKGEAEAIFRNQAEFRIGVNQEANPGRIAQGTGAMTGYEPQSVGKARQGPQPLIGTLC